MKKCSKCKNNKDECEFAKKTKNKDGLQNFCKECNSKYFHEYYMKNPKKFIENNNKKEEELKKIIREIKDKASCMICGENHPATLDFHHRNPKEKEGNIIELVYRGVSIKHLLTEIEKCDIYCSNCHRKKHYETLGL